jgi:hypothetical protein
MNRRWIVLTGAQSGKRLIVEISTIEQVHESGIMRNDHPSGPDNWDGLTPLEYTEVFTTRGRYQVAESFDAIYDAMRN